MLLRLNHVAIAVPDLGEAVALYSRMFGASVSSPQNLPDHGVTVAFVDMPGSRVELLEPLGENSPIAAYLSSHPKGGMHHLCYEVDDVAAAARRIEEAGGRILGDGRPRIGAHGKPVVFVHPADALGTLVELQEA